MNTQTIMSFVADSHKEPGFMDYKYDFNVNSLIMDEFKHVVAVFKGIQ